MTEHNQKVVTIISLCVGIIIMFGLIYLERRQADAQRVELMDKLIMAGGQRNILLKHSYEADKERDQLLERIRRLEEICAGRKPA